MMENIEIYVDSTSSDNEEIVDECSDGQCTIKIG